MPRRALGRRRRSCSGGPRRPTRTRRRVRLELADVDQHQGQRPQSRSTCVSIRSSRGLVPGAARYEIEIKPSADFPVGLELVPHRSHDRKLRFLRRRCCATTATTDAYVRSTRTDTRRPEPRDTLHQAVDSVGPNIPNLKVRDVNGHELSGALTTETPIVAWDPFPGASRCEVQLGPYTSGICDCSQVAFTPYYG